MNDTRGKTKEKKNWLTVRDFLALQSVFINTETAPPSVCEGRKSGKCWTSSSLETTDQSLHLKLSISIHLGLPSDRIKGMGSLHQYYTINWYHLAQKGGQSEEEEATVTNHNKILWTHSYTLVPFLTKSCPVAFKDCIYYPKVGQKEKCLFLFVFLYFKWV